MIRKMLALLFLVGVVGMPASSYAIHFCHNLGGTSCGGFPVVCVCFTATTSSVVSNADLIVQPIGL